MDYMDKHSGLEQLKMQGCLYYRPQLVGRPDWHSSHILYLQKCEVHVKIVLLLTIIRTKCELSEVIRTTGEQRVTNYGTLLNILTFCLINK